MVATNDLRIHESVMNTGTAPLPTARRASGLLARLSIRFQGRVTESTDAGDRITVIGRGRADQALDDRRSREADWALGRWTRLS